jgi:hypothetical protein
MALLGNRRNPLARRLLGVGALVLGLIGPLGMPRQAEAFCRNTTCKDSDKKTCLKDEQGCTTEGKPLFWATSCIGFHMNDLGTQLLDKRQARAAIMASFRSWSQVVCADGKTASMAFVPLEDVPCKRAEYNRAGKNVNVVLFQDDDWKYRGIDGTLAKTNATFDTDTGEILDADIEVNSAFNQLTVSDESGKVQYDLQAILTHEVGHFLGIGHTSDDRAAMYPAYSPGTLAIRKLGTDDRDAVCKAYPPNNGVACNEEPKGGYSPTCDEPAADTAASSGCEAAPLVVVNRESAGTSSRASDTLVLVSFAGALGLTFAVRRRRRLDRSDCS